MLRVHLPPVSGTFGTRAEQGWDHDVEVEYLFSRTVRGPGVSESKEGGTSHRREHRPFPHFVSNTVTGVCEGGSRDTGGTGSTRRADPLCYNRLTPPEG